jgi:hypothetical protein
VVLLSYSVDASALGRVCDTGLAGQKSIEKGYAAFPILNMAVEHEGHVPFVAGFPFLRVTGFIPAISRFALHFTQ